MLGKTALDAVGPNHYEERGKGAALITYEVMRPPRLKLLSRGETNAHLDANTVFFG